MQNGMDITRLIYSESIILASYLVMIGLLAFSMVMAPWEKIRQDSTAQNVYLGATVLVILVWMIRADLPTGLNFHLLATTLLCLLFEWQFALFSMAVVVAVHTMINGIPPENYALNWLTLGALPVVICRIALYLVQRYLPHNFYIYIFINAFLVAGIGAYLAGAFSAVWLYYALDYSSHLILDQYLPALILIMLPEAVTTGMVMTILVVYKPAWVATFHDRWYLKNR
jgi:uncharacterized membrane protein